MRKRCKATAAWTWSDFLGSISPAGKRVVHVNMDETAVKFWQEGGAGYVQIPSGVIKAEFLETEAKVSLSKKRMVCSLLGFISDDEETQRLLPQVFVVNKRSLTEAATREVQASLQGSTT